MQSIVLYPDRGQGGNSRWRGNFAPQLIEDLIDQFHLKAIADPMMGSGTTPDVCRRLNVKCWATDLHQSFDTRQANCRLASTCGYSYPFDRQL